MMSPKLESAHSPGSKTILLVEDDLPIRRSTALCLRKLGYTVFDAMDDSEAVISWNNHRQTIDLLLTDLNLPGKLNGFELGRRFKTEKKSLAAIVSSGDTSLMAMPRDFGFLAKPYTPAALAKYVRDWLDNGRAEVEGPSQSM